MLHYFTDLVRYLYTGSFVPVDQHYGNCEIVKIYCTAIDFKVNELKRILLIYFEGKVSVSEFLDLASQIYHKIGDHNNPLCYFLK